MLLASLSLLSYLLFSFFFITKTAMLAPGAHSNSYTGNSCCANCNGRRSLT